MTRKTRILFDTVGPYRNARLVGALLLGLLALVACDARTALSDASRVEIYAAVVRRIYTQDDTFGGTLQPPTLYLVRTTDDSVGDPDAGRSEPERLPEAVQSGVSQALADMPTRIVWVDERDQVPLNPNTNAVIDGGAIITLGNVHPQDDGSAHVAGSIYVAMLAAGGRTYVVEQVDGAWEVTGTTGVIWMS
jgi:hypothetical protein